MPRMSDLEKMEIMRATLENLAAWHAEKGESIESLLQSVKDEAENALRKTNER